MTGLQVEHLTRTFGKTVAVDNLSFSASRGEILGLLGPNGAGKSTTFMCLAGLLRPDAGSIRHDGEILGPQRGRTISLIPETPEVYNMLTVWEHMVFVARSCSLAPEWISKAETLLDRFALQNKRNTLGQALSKGMRQKTLVAATILADAPVMLFDEPMIGLDPLGQRELRDILQALRTQGTAVIISTHLLESAENLCDRVLILKEGRSVAEGSIAQLRASDAGATKLEDVFLDITR